jgi:hypothetical protein
LKLIEYRKDFSMRLVYAFTALVVLGSSAVAGELYDVTSVGKGKSEDVVHALSESHIIMQTQNQYSGFEGSHEMFSQVTGTCFGTAEMKSGSLAGNGNCKFDDADGDSYFNSWTISGLAEDGATVGTWVIIGGTGKFSGATGGGDFHSVTDTSTGMFENQVTGVMMLP